MNILSLKGLKLKHAKTYQTTFESDTISDTLKKQELVLRNKDKDICGWTFRWGC